MKKNKKQNIFIFIVLLLLISTLFYGCNNDIRSKTGKDGSITGTLTSTRINEIIEKIVINKTTGKAKEDHYFYETKTVEAFNLYKENFKNHYNIYRLDFFFKNKVDEYTVTNISFDITLTSKMTMYFILYDTYSDKSILTLQKTINAEETTTVEMPFSFDATSIPSEKDKGLKLNFCLSELINQREDSLVPKKIENIKFTVKPKK